MKNLSTLILIIFIIGCSKDVETIDPIEDQYKKDIAQIERFLDSNSITANIDEGTGIRYVVNDPGTGLDLYFADSLTLTYSASLLSSGAIFDEVTSKKFGIENILTGIIYSSTFVREGGSVTAYIPSYLGYGTTETDAVPVNSVIIADIIFEKLHYKRLTDEIKFIEDSLVNAEVEPLVHPSGIRYYLEQGTGISPTSKSSVTVKYEGKIFGGDVFDSNDNATFKLSGLIAGWQVMLPEVKEGGKITMILPSPFGYGSGGSSSIPPNSILVFEVELISVN
jgi:FKBP-type peptidyl-prolyl cis-trans isomerase